MHSSRMRTARALSASRSIRRGGACLPGGPCVPGGMHAPPGMQGGVHVCLGGMHATHTPSPHGQTDTCENNLRKLCLRAVNIRRRL